MTEPAELYRDIPALYATCETLALRMAQRALIHALPPDTAMALALYSLDRDPILAIAAVSHIWNVALRQEIPALAEFLVQVVDSLAARPTGKYKRMMAETVLKFTEIPGCASSVYAALLRSEFRTIRSLAFKYMSVDTARHYADALERELENPALWVIRNAIRLLPLDRLDANWQVLWEHGKYHDRFALLRRGMTVSLSVIDAEKGSDPLGWAVWRLLRRQPVPDKDLEDLFWSLERASSVAMLFHGLAQAGKYDLLLRLSREYSSVDYRARFEPPKSEVPSEEDLSEYDPFSDE